jgi:hypothetical protein
LSSPFLEEAQADLNEPTRQPRALENKNTSSREIFHGRGGEIREPVARDNVKIEVRMSPPERSPNRSTVRQFL